MTNDEGNPNLEIQVNYRFAKGFPFELWPSFYLS